MALRKEQVLLLLAVALGAMIWKSGSGDEWRAPRLADPAKGYEPEPVPAAPLLTGKPAEVPTRRWFREPSETEPLPPRPLPFPEREQLFLVALPLDPGPDLARADLLRIPSAVVEGVALETAGQDSGEDAGGGPTPEESPVVVQGAEDKHDRYARQYDRVKIQGQGSTAYYGILRAPGYDLYDLEERDEGELNDVVVHLLRFSIDKEKLLTPEVTFGKEPATRVIDIELANNLRNAVARRVRKVPEDAAHVPDRHKLIDDLLVMARQEAWIYDVAMEQADVLERTDAGLGAARAKARVLARKGDIAGEFELYRGLSGNGHGTSGPVAAFRHEGLGNLEARLGLYAAAEADLRTAVELAPTDARPHASLADFLRRQGRPREAYAMARRAVATLGSVTDPGDRRRVIHIAIACQLGVGDLDGARQTLGEMRADPAHTSYLRACIDYSQGDVAAARDGFRSAVTADYGSWAQFGLAACQVRLGQWQEAQAGFAAVAADAPLLRHRAHCGLALLYLRIGQFDVATTHADRALEADPLDAYAYYLRARGLAGQGQMATALEALMAALRLRDDFVPALAEVADLRLRLAQQADPTEQATHALSAMRYADRAVELSAVPLVSLYELQALAHFTAADLRGARAAFTRARDAADDEDRRLFARAGLCVVDYADDHVEEARMPLERLQTDLPREHPIRDWATRTLLMIDDHAQKEQLDDTFDRGETGNVWKLNRDRGLKTFDVVDNKFVIRGTLSKADEVTATRAGAVQKAGKFLAVATTMGLGAAHQKPNTFAGLRITSGAGGGGEFTAQVGLRDGKPFWLVREGRNEPSQAPVAVEQAAPGPHRLELRVQDRGDNQFKLLVVFDDVVVHEQDLTMLRAVDTKELETTFVVSGPGGTNVDVHFDDYHLERRKD